MQGQKPNVPSTRSEDGGVDAAMLELERMQLRSVLSSEFTLTREGNGQMESGPKEANWERGGSKGWIWSRYVTYM